MANQTRTHQSRRTYTLAEGGVEYRTVRSTSIDAALEVARKGVSRENYTIEQSIVIEIAARHRDGSELSGTVTLDPEEPNCSDENGHEWQSPHDLVGGCKENPGVWGSGHGGIKMNSVCIHCGCKRRTDTGATRSDNGARMTSVEYEPGAYRDALVEDGLLKE